MLFRSLGLAPTRIDDAPGLIVARTLAPLVDTALEAAQAGIASEADIDLAMTKGVNYPAGPLAWAEAIGLPRILAVIDNLARFYGEDRYRASPLLRRRVLAGAAAFGAPEL